MPWKRGAADRGLAACVLVGYRTRRARAPHAHGPQEHRDTSQIQISELHWQAHSCKRRPHAQDAVALAWPRNGTFFMSLTFKVSTTLSSSLRMSGLQGAIRAAPSAGVGPGAVGSARAHTARRAGAGRARMAVLQSIVNTVCNSTENAQLSLRSKLAGTRASQPFTARRPRLALWRPRKGCHASRFCRRPFQALSSAERAQPRLGHTQPAKLSALLVLGGPTLDSLEVLHNLSETAVHSSSLRATHALVAHSPNAVGPRARKRAGAGVHPELDRCTRGSPLHHRGLPPVAGCSLSVGAHAQLRQAQSRSAAHIRSGWMTAIASFAAAATAVHMRHEEEEEEIG